MNNVMKKLFALLLLTAVIAGSLCLGFTKTVYAGAKNGIAGNGLNGIWIDINASPYTDRAKIQNHGQYAYSNLGCAWFASARVTQITGKCNTIFSGTSWYNTQYRNHGFSRGRDLKNEKALACYSGHVRVVELVDGNTVTVSEGGWGPGRPDNGYCIIHTMSKKEVESGGFLGYVYLGVSAAPPAPTTPPALPIGSSISAGSRTIPDGDYHIITEVDNNMCLDISKASTANGANAWIWHSTDDPKQAFSVKWMGSAKGYKIINKYTGKCLEVGGNNKNRGANVQQWDYCDNPSETQQWVIAPSGNGTYSLRCKGSGFYLDVDNGRALNEANVQVWEGNGSAAQKWRFVPWGSPIPGGFRTIPDGDYHIITGVDNNMCLDIANASKDNGANAWIWHSTDDPKQVFSVKWMGSGKGYKIINKFTGKCLEVAGNTWKEGANVQQWDYCDNPYETQQWVIAPSGNGTYSLRCKGSGFYLDVDNGRRVDRTNVQVWTGNGTASQKWKFIPFKTTADETDKGNGGTGGGNVTTGGGTGGNGTGTGTESSGDKEETGGDNTPGNGTGSDWTTPDEDGDNPDEYNPAPDFGDGDSDSSDVTVKEPEKVSKPVSPKISKKSLTLKKGKSYKLKVKNTRKKVKWSSNKKSVATVSKTGKVKAKKKGTAVITAKIGNKKYKCTVKVK